jgi:hypothetical protein
MTALGKPEFLQHLSMILNETRGQFSSFHAEAGVPAPATLTLDAFRGQAQKFRAGLSDDEIEALFKVVDVDGSGCVDFIEWLDYVEPLRVRCLHAFMVGSVCNVRVAQLCMVPVEDPRHLQFLAPGSRNTMTQNDITRFANMLRRLDCLADAAKQGSMGLCCVHVHTYAFHVSRCSQLASHSWLTLSKRIYSLPSITVCSTCSVGTIRSVRSCTTQFSVT